MPHVDGLTATRTLRSLGVASTVIAVTGTALASDQAEFLAAGADALWCVA